MTKAEKILDTKFEEKGLFASIDKNSEIYETCLSAINKALTSTSVVIVAKNKEVIISKMKKMTDYERLDIITEFCKYCGDLDSDCHCSNDE